MCSPPDTSVLFYVVCVYVCVCFISHSPLLLVRLTQHTHTGQGKWHSESKPGGYKKSENGSHHSFNQFQLSLPSAPMALVEPLLPCSKFNHSLLIQILRTDLSQKAMIMRKIIRMLCLNLFKNQFQLYPLKRVQHMLVLA
jgi:hypothetical protein